MNNKENPNLIDGFEEQQSFFEKSPKQEEINEMMKAFGRRIKVILKRSKLGISSYCVGYHIRNVLDIKSPRVTIFTHSKDSQIIANEINRLMLSRSYHTMNHVMDSLYYHKKDNGNDKPSYLILYLSTKLEKDKKKNILDTNVCDFRVEADEKYNGLQLKAYVDLTKIKLGKNPKKIVTEINKYSDKILLNDEDKDRELFFDLYKLSSELLLKVDLAPSVFNSNAIISALFQLYSYSIFGHQNIIIMYRPANQWDYVCGVTVIYDSTSEPEFIAKEINNLVKNEFENIRQVKFSERFKIERINADDSLSIASNLIVKLRPKSLPQNATTTDVDSTIIKFLTFAAEFCHEKYEGKDVKYGLILGNTKLLQYWSHTPIYSLTKKNEWLAKQEITRQIHLGENPSETAIIVPFSPKGRDSGTYPAFLLDLSNFLESLATSNELSLWPTELKGYAFITKRYKWALAAVVGPNNVMRLFVNGELLVFRSGKFWHSLFDKDNFSSKEFKPEYDEDKEFNGFLKSLSIPERDKLFLFIELSNYISPFLNEDSHGALIGYTPVTEKKLEKLLKKNKLQNLSFSEPLVTFKNGVESSWLTGKKLVNKKKSGSFNLNYETANYIKKATKIDGAIVLYGENLNVFGFRLNLKLPPYLSDNSNNANTGTKDAAASSFVSFFKNNKSYCVKISADGPITFYYSKLDKGKYVINKYPIWREIAITKK